MALSKNDFIEIEYIGRIKNSHVFDTNIKEEAKKINLEIETNPLIICLGQNMILPAIDLFLIGKKPGAYTLDLEPEKAFGLRKQELVKTFSLNAFRKQNIAPAPGMIFSFDNLFGKITSVSSGRVIVDFNNPLAGKQIEYKIIVKRQVTELNEKIKALLAFYMRKDLNFEIKDKKLIVNATRHESKLLEFFKKKFKDILNLELEIKEIQEKKESVEQKVNPGKDTQTISKEDDL
jgi:FKBP-type peptidyl-prolyl cis-trans isomerase 2